MQMLSSRLRRVVALAAVCMGLFALSASSAYAFECYNAIRSAQGNQSAAQANALFSLEEILSNPDIVGLCPEGVDFVIAGLEEAGFRTDVLINFRTLMAQGLERVGKEEFLHDGTGVDHLSDEFFATVDPLIGQAFGLCT
jgi:hypothetical protein